MRRSEGITDERRVMEESERESVSRANQAAAFDRMSRSSRNCLFSRRSRVNSSRSAAVRPGATSSRRPSFRSAWATHARMEWPLGSNSRARSSGLRPARTRSTICRRNSGEYGGRVLGIGNTSGKSSGVHQTSQGVHQTGSIPIPVLEILGETPVVSEPGIRCARQASGAAGRQSLSCRRCARRSRPPQDPLASDHELLVDFRDHSLSALAFPLVGLPAHPFRFWRGTVPGRLALAAELTV